jgi:hypothetical protein
MISGSLVTSSFSRSSCFESASPLISESPSKFLQPDRGALRIEEPYEQVRRPISVAVAAQKPDTGLANRTTPVRSRETPALVKVPLPRKWQAMNVTNVAFQNSIYLNMAPLVPAIKPRELEIAIQFSHYNDVHFGEAGRY